MIDKKIGIVTVLYNSERVLDDFICSLNKQTYKNFILYVIDNKSSDNSLEEIKQLTSDVFFETKIIPNEENYGVAKGNNQGILEGIKDSCDYILLCNNDIVIPESTLLLLVNELTNNDFQLIVPKILFYKSQKIWFAGGKFSFIPGSIRHIGYGETDNGKYDEIKEISYAPTCFMMIKSEVFQKVGLMDEKYFVYFDDTDFLYRAIIKNNLKLLYYPKTSIQHKESFSTGGVKSDFTLKYYYRNKIYFIKKHFKKEKLFFAINYVYFYIKRPFIGKDMYLKVVDSLKSGLMM